MTRKDYIAIAEAIKSELKENERDCSPSQLELVRLPVIGIAHKLAQIMAADNPRFERDKFLDACGL